MADKRETMERWPQPSTAIDSEQKWLLCDLETGLWPGTEDHNDADHKVSVSMPTTMKVMDGAGKIKNINISHGDVIACLGLPPPPGGWYGPFGFFRLLSYAFLAVFVLAIVFAMGSMADLDLFGWFAAVLLAIAAIVSAAAAFAHEGLANEVSEMARQNDEFAEKNEVLEGQLKELGGVAEKLRSLESELGLSADQLKSTMDALHRQTSIQQLASMLGAFCDADRDGDGNQRLTKGEVEDFFDGSNAILRGACPTFDFEALKRLSLNVGIGMYAMRFMVNALIAAGDDNPHKSTAELSLIMFCFDPEGHMETCLSDLKLVLGGGPEMESQLRAHLKQKRANFARPEEGGRIPCKELHDISCRVMACDRVVAPPNSAAKSALE